MLPDCPPTITTPEGVMAWYERRSKTQHSVAARTWDIRQCNPTAPIDPCLRCPICLGVLWNALETPCGHAFCADCLISAMKISPTCPLDRNPVPQPPDLPLRYPNDHPMTRLLRELWAFRACGAVLDVKGSVKQALTELKATCPFRESEGCMAELPWDAWELRTHITEMRHGDPVHQKSRKFKDDLRERTRGLRRGVRKITRWAINSGGPETKPDGINTDGELLKAVTTTECGISANVAAATPFVPIASPHHPLAATAPPASATGVLVSFVNVVAGCMYVVAAGLNLVAAGLNLVAARINLGTAGINAVTDGINRELVVSTTG